MTRRDVFVQWSKTTGRVHPKLKNLKKLPVELIYLWRVFCELSGPDLTFSEIKAYCETTRTLLWPWEVKALKALDNMRRTEMEKRWRK